MLQQRHTYLSGRRLGSIQPVVVLFGTKTPSLGLAQRGFLLLNGIFWPCSAWLSPLEQHLLVPWRCTVFCNSFLLFNMLTCNQGQQYSCSDQNQQSLRGDAPGRR